MKRPGRPLAVLGLSGNGKPILGEAPGAALHLPFVKPSRLDAW